MTAADFAPRSTSRPVTASELGPSDYDAEVDVVVVGGGGGGLPAALFARWLGNDVVLVEKAPELGGTARKAAFWYWIPNNKPMQALGVDDTEKGFLRYVARLSRPQCYDPDSPTFGMAPWEYDLCRGIYQSASEATELLNAAARSSTATAPRSRTTGPSWRRTPHRPVGCWCPPMPASRCPTADRWRSAR